ncbi:class I SAM-dependent methyltransferase [Bacillus sp. B15-48]|uniref:class I SAM-dependent methyltransferase n=1 Tax=Bacillus sp. B15-48 TaxID=1548601 RepID=UPI00193F9550|nr:class I SAM-dependent methyltransferase [Bacillus sp. B15-48]MBM4760864.1 methyltransferase domain-containing protein [Bacillus sp. B15-48]
MNFNYHDALATGGISAAHPGGFNLTKKILDGEKLKKGSFVLDAGCGTGQTAAYLAKEKKCKVYALDLHPDMLEHTKSRFKEDNLPGKFIKGNIENLPFPDDSFDVVIAESTTIFTNINKTTNEYFRVLKKGGWLLNTELTSEGSLTEEEIAPIKSFYHIKHIPTEAEWVQLYEKAGFHDVEILKRNTILGEIEDFWTQSDDQSIVDMPTNLDRRTEKVLADHSRLMMRFGEDLGYRAFKAMKA